MVTNCCDDQASGNGTRLVSHYVYTVHAILIAKVGILSTATFSVIQSSSVSSVGVSHLYAAAAASDEEE